MTTERNENERDIGNFCVEDEETVKQRSIRSIKGDFLNGFSGGCFFISLH